MQFSAILTSIALLGAFSVSTFSSAHAQTRDLTRADSTLMEMAQSYKSRDRKRLISLLPQARGHVLEPWAAYWDLSARLDEAGPTEIQEFFSRYSGSYQEDRLRAEWLMQLGKNRDWAAFNREYPLYRMNDEKSVRCYALLAETLATGVDNTAQVKDLWLGMKDTDDGCASAAEQLLKDHATPVTMLWQRARLGMENDRLRVVTQAVNLVAPDSSKIINSIYLNPGKYLNDKLTALQPKTREFVSLALIRQAYLDPEEAAIEINKLRWKAQLTGEERSWIWGSIGKRAAQKSLPDAPHEIIVVLDANIGQNAVNQVVAFDDALGLTGLIVTKLDGTAKGGVLAALASSRPIPVRYIGVGEKIDDLRPFDARAFVDALLD